MKEHVAGAAVRIAGGYRVALQGQPRRAIRRSNVSNCPVPPGRNDPCHCGSGKKYKKCHLDIDTHGRRALVEAMPIVQKNMAQSHEYARRLRDEYGVYINYVSPVEFQDRKVWALGSRVYPNRRPNETFHEFLLGVLRDTFGEQWRVGQAALADDDRHFVLKCFEQLARWQAAHADQEILARDGHISAVPNGWVRYVISLAWDVATLMHAADLPDALVGRLRDRQQFQGARYEIAIAAIFARLDCSIRFLDDDPKLLAVQHVEFEATHRPTGQQFAVEAKSRHRRGVVNQPGEPDVDDPLRNDVQGVRKLFKKAIAQAPASGPFFVFIDVNAPLDGATADRWGAHTQRWLGEFPPPTVDEPDIFNALYVTNFSPHYDGDDISRKGSWLAAVPMHVRTPLVHDVRPALQCALDTYGSVPAFAGDGVLLT